MAIQEFDAYSYRVTARFGSIVHITIDKDVPGGGRMEITGPRLGKAVYSWWLWMQVLMNAAMIGLIIAAAAYRDWRYLAGAAVLFVVHFLFGGAGAAGLWESDNLNHFIDGKYSKASFPLGAVRDVKIGKGWARGVIILAIAQFVPGINTFAKDVTVSFMAPEGETGKYVLYGLHMRDTRDAKRLVEAMTQ